ncbi:MAG: cyclase family protein [Rhizobiaceae bacterium]|nr:cyclase family protein [Rhizobiaceae bacterium]
MRRTIDASQVIEPTVPLGSILPPDVRPPHREPFSESRHREDIMFVLNIEDAHIGSEPISDRFQYLLTTVDPCGTHVETYYPVKWFYEGAGDRYARDVGDIPASVLVNDAAVFDITDLERPLGPGDLIRNGKHIRKGDSVILRSGFNRGWEDPGLGKSSPMNAYKQRHGLTAEGARWLTDQEAKVCALDFRQPEDPEYKWELPSHKQLHTNDVLIVEDIAHLDQISQERVVLVIGAPIKGRHLTGGPARIVAIEGWGTKDVKVLDLTHIMGRYPARAQPARPLGSRRHAESSEWSSFNRAEYVFFDIGMQGLADLVGPQYMRLSTRAGTHMVNPYSADAQGASPLYGDIADIPAERLVGPGSLVDLSDVGAGDFIDAAALEGRLDNVRAGDWVVLRTGHADWHQGSRDGTSVLAESPKLTTEAIARLAAMGARGIISDISAATSLDRRREVESALHEHNMLFVAGARRLWLLRKDRFLAAALPLRVRGLVHSPAHVFLIEDWKDDSWL